MSANATGAATSPDGLLKFNTANDKPNGAGVNEMMDQLQTVMNTKVSKPTGIVTGEVPVWNGSTWVRSSATNIGTSSISGGVGMQLIADLTLGSDQASFDTNAILSGNIPGTYKHLHAKLVTRTSSGNNFDAVNLQANGITTATYASSWMQANAGLVGHTIGLTATSGRAGITTGVAAGSWAQAAIDFLDYTNANAKNLQGVSSVVKNNASNADFVNEQNYAWISGVTAAITRLVFVPSAGNWKAGSRFTLYGLS